MKLPVYPDQRPLTRGDCHDMPRPCPFISCKHHLLHAKADPYHGKKPSDDEIVDMIVESEDTCALDVADEGGLTTRQVADALKITHQGVCSVLARVADRDNTGPAVLDLAHSLSERHREPFDLYAPGDIISERHWKKKARRESGESL